MRKSIWNAQSGDDLSIPECPSASSEPSGLCMRTPYCVISQAPHDTPITEEILPIILCIYTVVGIVSVVMEMFVES